MARGLKKHLSKQHGDHPDIKRMMKDVKYDICNYCGEGKSDLSTHRKACKKRPGSVDKKRKPEAPSSDSDSEHEDKEIQAKETELKVKEAELLQREHTLCLAETKFWNAMKEANKNLQQERKAFEKEKALFSFEKEVFLKKELKLIQDQERLDRISGDSSWSTPDRCPDSPALEPTPDDSEYLRKAKEMEKNQRRKRLKEGAPSLEDFESMGMDGDVAASKE